MRPRRKAILLFVKNEKISRRDSSHEKCLPCAPSVAVEIKRISDRPREQYSGTRYAPLNRIRLRSLEPADAGGGYMDATGMIGASLVVIGLAVGLAGLYDAWPLTMLGSAIIIVDVAIR